MSRTPTLRVGLFLFAAAPMLLGARLLFSPGTPAAEPADRNTPPALKAEQSPKTPAARKQRPAAPPMKDLRLTDEKDSAEDQIEDVLSKPTEVNFSELPLEEALSLLKQQHRLDLWIDRHALKEAEIALDDPVTLQLSGIRLESILNLLLEPHDLDWLIQDEVLKITTKARAAALAETRTFKIQELLDAGHTVEELMDAIVKCVEPDSWTDAGGVGTISHSGGVLICRQSQRVQIAVAVLLLELEEMTESQLEEQRAGAPVVTLQVYHTLNYSADELAEALKALVAPESWLKEEINLRPIKGALLVQQTPAVHREIQKVLKKLMTPPAPALGGGEGLPAPSTSFEGATKQRTSPLGRKAMTASFPLP